QTATATRLSWAVPGKEPALTANEKTQLRDDLRAALTAALTTAQPRDADNKPITGKQRLLPADDATKALVAAAEITFNEPMANPMSVSLFTSWKEIKTPADAAAV